MTYDFDGSTYDRALDRKALSKQFETVKGIMGDGNWHTLPELAHKTGAPEASVSARLRDLRKLRFGGWEIERERPASGRLFRYRAVVR